MAEATPKEQLVAAGSDRTEELRAAMAERILVLDGATGTMLQSQDLGPDDFRFRGLAAVAARRFG